MKLITEPSKILFMFIASGAIATSAIAGPCGGAKPEKVARYKTPQMVTFVNTTINFLNSEEKPNRRHLNVLEKCQRIFNSGKATAKGMDAKNLKTCRNLSNMGLYNTKNIAINTSEDQIKNSEKSASIKIVNKKKINKIVETDNTNTLKDSNLLLF